MSSPLLLGAGWHCPLCQDQLGTDDQLVCANQPACAIALDAEMVLLHTGESALARISGTLDTRLFRRM
jgi:hypothetical protein